MFYENFYIKFNMKLLYKNKKPEHEIVSDKNEVKLINTKNNSAKNKLIFTENKLGLSYLINHEKLIGKIDLVYIDPPFATNNTFRVDDSRSSTISHNKNGNIAYQDKIVGSDFIEFIRERLILLKELISPKGSIYLHTDYKIGHYVKVIMDEIFGIENFRNDITRIKCNPKNFDRKSYGNIKDMILFYSKSNNLIWNNPKTPYSKIDEIKLFPRVNKEGRRYTTVPLHAPGETLNGKTSERFNGLPPPAGRHWRTSVEALMQLDKEGLIEWSDSGNPRKIIYFDEREGKKTQDIWEFKDPLHPIYPTEKNASILETIISASSHENSYVLDCFCGSGITLEIAQRLGRNWIGIDQSIEAIRVAENRMKSLKADALFDTSPDYEFLIPFDTDSQSKDIKDIALKTILNTVN